MSSNSSSSIASSVPNYLRPTTASSAVQAAGDKPSPARRKSLDRPLSHLDTHRNLTGDKPSPARRKTKSSLDRPKSSTAMSRTSEANDRRGKIMTRSISSVSKSSSIAHNHHLKTTPNKTQKNSTRKQPDHEELEDLKSIEDCSSLSSVLEDPPIDPVDTITEEGDAEAISVPENLQESGQTQSADTIPHTTPEDPKVEDKAGGEINLKETTPADEISVEEKGDETIHSKANKPALKRNESVVSNDVIEETASKLREQRKNKVKALAGAFETVISLQDK
nr:suppressor protein SRP40-like [Ipomoea batatas]